jgi:hypothetical protein
MVGSSGLRQLALSTQRQAKVAYCHCKVGLAGDNGTINLHRLIQPPKFLQSHGHVGVGMVMVGVHSNGMAIGGYRVLKTLLALLHQAEVIGRLSRHGIQRDHRAIQRFGL